MYKKIFVILGLFVILVPASASAWDDCPFGEIDDPYPGECNRYMDTDDDGICDHSQLAPEDRHDEILIKEIDNGIDETFDGASSAENIDDSKNREGMLHALLVVILPVFGLVLYSFYQKIKR